MSEDCGDEMSEDLEDDPQDYLDLLEEGHEDLDEEDDSDDGAYEEYLEALGDRYDELEGLEAAAAALTAFKLPDFGKHVDKADKLDQVDPQVAKLISESGLADGDSSDDVVKVSRKTLPAAALKPSQTTMQLPKAIGMALFMLKKGKVGGDLGALISKDRHILDGHHRWAATILAAGKEGQVGGWLAGLPGKELLKVLNIVSKGMFKVRNGNPGSGKITDFTEGDVRELLADYVQNGIPGKFPWKAEDVQSVLTDNFGSVEEGIDTMSANVKLLSTKVPAWAPDRKQMPVIEPEQAPDAADALNEGVIDWNDPHLSGALSARLKELEQLEAVASDTEFMEACAEFGLEEFILAKTRMPDLKPNQIDTSEEDPSLRRYLDERQKLYPDHEGRSYVNDVDDNAIELQHTEKKLQKACVEAAAQIRAAKVDYPKALLVAQDIEGELDRLAQGKVRASVSYIALKGVRLKMRKLKAMIS
jgi:hypothetical protein